jgi:4-amino-4-deoxy-L-arabinose transferase-like glycosyltransferase
MQTASPSSDAAGTPAPADTPAPAGTPAPTGPGAADADAPALPLRAVALLGPRGAGARELVLVTLLALAVLVPGIGSYTLVDPWETHYSEVSRRMLQDHDLVHTKWQDEGFRSKPVLTFWMIAAGLRSFGLAEDGGFSGEMTSTSLVLYAVRLPFVLFGVLGLVMLFWLLARLVNRRVAWLGFLIVATTPFYALVARQAITDIPLVACLMGAVACFAMAVHAEDEPLRPLFHVRGRAIDAFHVFLAALVLFVGWQILYYAYYFTVSPQLAPGVRFPVPQVILPGAMLLGLGGFVVWAVRLSPTRHVRQVYMYWFYMLVAVSVLAKGLPAIGLAGVICFFYLLLTGQWRLLGKLEIPRGILICLLVAVPWHLAMILKDGRPFLRDYFITHLWRRAAFGVHGERGTFDFFVSQLGIGMVPWVALVPAAVGSVLGRFRSGTRADSVRLLVGIWAVVTMAFFVAVQTKFHHYILPVVPALGVLIAFWLDDVLAGRVRHVAIPTLAGAVVAALVMRDLAHEHKQIIEMFVYRYDRPWPSGAPWFVDASDAFLGFGLAAIGTLLLFCVPRLRRLGLAAFAVVALGYSLWTSNVYMQHAGKHWGMLDAMQTYYRERQIHGIDLRYYGARQLADEWDGFTGEYLIESALPEHFSPGQPMTIHIEIADNAGIVAHEIDLSGTVSRIGDNRFWVAIAPEELARLSPHIEKGRGEPEPRMRPWKQVNADRLIAWQLYWRGENFWSNDEIWGRFDDTKTAFKDTDNKSFLAYLDGPGRKNRRYFLITEAGRARGLKNILPTEQAKQTYEILDTSSNKFTLLTFVL